MIGRFLKKTLRIIRQDAFEGGTTIDIWLFKAAL